VTAVSRGERPNAHAIAVPSSTDSVATAAAASASGPEWLWNSGAQTESNPARSARAASSMFSRCVGSSSSRPSATARPYPPTAPAWRSACSGCSLARTMISRHRTRPRARTRARRSTRAAPM
jgi:hypothetical protein